MTQRQPPNHGPDHVNTATDPAAFADWPDGLWTEMQGSMDNGCVGSVLVSETDRVRVWHLKIAPGKRCPFHRHLNPYFWTALSAGKARGYFSSGEIRDVTHYVGETKHFHYGPGDSMVHSVENTGDTELLFATVEFLDGTNKALDISDDMRLIPLGGV